MILRLINKGLINMRITKANLKDQYYYEEFENFLLQEVYVKFENIDDIDEIMEEVYKLATPKNYKAWLNDDLQI